MAGLWKLSVLKLVFFGGAYRMTNKLKIRAENSVMKC